MILACRLPYLSVHLKWIVFRRIDHVTRINAQLLDEIPVFHENVIAATRVSRRGRKNRAHFIRLYSVPDSIELRESSLTKNGNPYPRLLGSCLFVEVTLKRMKEIGSLINAFLTDLTIEHRVFGDNHMDVWRTFIVLLQLVIKEEQSRNEG